MFVNIIVMIILWVGIIITNRLLSKKFGDLTVLRVVWSIAMACGAMCMVAGAKYNNVVVQIVGQVLVAPAVIATALIITLLLVIAVVKLVGIVLDTIGLL